MQAQDDPIDPDALVAAAIEVNQDAYEKRKLLTYHVKPGFGFDQMVAMFAVALGEAGLKFSPECFTFTFRWVDRRWVMFVDMRKASYYEQEIKRILPPN